MSLVTRSRGASRASARQINRRSKGLPGPTTTKSLTKAQKLSKALKACRKDRSKTKLLACEKQAKRKYPLTKKKSKAKNKK
jgi:hypothetical protein